jgi:hypothetical protein
MPRNFDSPPPSTTHHIHHSGHSNNRTQAPSDSGPRQKDTAPPITPLPANVRVWDACQRTPRRRQSTTSATSSGISSHQRNGCHFSQPLSHSRSTPSGGTRPSAKKFNHPPLLERPVSTSAPLSIDRVQKNGCALLCFDFVYGDLVLWLEGEYTNFNFDYDTMFDNLNDLRTTHMPTVYPKVDLDQTRETLKEGAPTNVTFISNCGHARQRDQ